VPLNKDFKDKGLSANVSPDGTVSAKPGSELFALTSPVQQQPSGGLFNLPSVPENLMILILYFLAMLGSLSFAYVRHKTYN
jgi:hypothetical protein